VYLCGGKRTISRAVNEGFIAFPYDISRHDYSRKIVFRPLVPTSKTNVPVATKNRPRNTTIVLKRNVRTYTIRYSNRHSRRIRSEFKRQVNGTANTCFSNLASRPNPIKNAVVYTDRRRRRLSARPVVDKLSWRIDRET